MRSSDIVFKQTESSPFIELNHEKNSLVIKGNSFVTDPKIYYKNLINWAENLSTSQTIIVQITPGYYSTSNIQIFNLLFRTLASKGIENVKIIFHIEKDEEEDMEETIYSLTFNTLLKPQRNYI